MFTLVSELAKNDVDSNSASTYLEELGFANERIKTFIQQYEVVKIEPLS